MIQREIGQSGIQASAIGLGTWAIGGWKWGGTDDAASIDAISAAIDNGISLIDTAPAYGMGRSEEIVGRAIQGRRDKVVIATKCGLVWHHQNGRHHVDQDGQPIHRYLGRASIIHEVEQSLRRLNTDYIDLYITHWQDTVTPISETMATLEELRDQGKIRAIGASNVSASDLQAYIAAGQLDAIQEQYNMVHRDIGKTLLPITAANNVATLSYSSLALGLLSGAMTNARVFKGDDLRQANPRFSPENRARVAAFMTAIKPIATMHDASLAQIVIAWTLQQAGVTFALCGARTAMQAQENAKAGSISLTPKDLAKIDSEIETHLAVI
ncbi:MAG: aldo/keto reductase [Paracoccaceae bacterium]|nr:aldo/keto reductase [Paracoccaceae bacterium]